MNKLVEMMEKRNKAWEGAKAFLESKRDKDGLISEEDSKTYYEMERKVKAYNFEIERLKDMEEMDKKLSKPTSNAIVTKPMKIEEKEKKMGRARDEYKNAMLSALRSNFKRLENVLQEGVDEDGGYLVPEEYDERLIETLKEENIMRTLATSIKTSGDHKINIAMSDPAAAWIEEGGELKFGDSKFAQKLLDSHKLHVAVKITEELLYDNAFDLEEHILKSFGMALSNAEEDAFLNGDGNGKPVGIFDKKDRGTFI